MNICFFDYDYSPMGGMQKVLCSLANNLLDTYNVSVITIVAKNVKSYFYLNEKIPVTVFNQKEGRFRTLVRTSFLPFKKYLKENKIDVCLLMGSCPNILALMAKPFVKTKFISCDHGALINQLDDKKTTYLRWLAAKHCDKVISLTKRNRDDYIERFKMPSDKIDYIYNYIDSPTLKPMYNSSSKKIVSLGRFSKEKGFHDNLLKVAKIVLERYPDWEWHIYGGGELFEQTKKSAEEMCIHNLVLKGPTKNSVGLYGDYSICVMTSYREGLPLVLIEAKQNKLPIVSFDCCMGPSEIIDDCENGFLVPCYDTDIMAQKLMELMADENLRNSFSQNSQKGMEQFEKEEIIKKWKDIINTVAEK